MVTLEIGGTDVQFLVDTGTAHSDLKTPLGTFSSLKSSITGATGQSASYPWTTKRTVNLGKGTVTHSFLVILECPYPLLERDLLQKLGAVISFEPEGGILELKPPSAIMVMVPLEDEFKLLKEGTEPPEQKWDYLQKRFPLVCAETNSPGLAKHHAPVVVQLLASATPARVWQYPLWLEAKGKRRLTESRVSTILQIPKPGPKKQVSEFLGAVGYWRIWIPGFAEIAKPLHEATAGGNTPLQWTEACQQTFQLLKTALTSAPALALPHLNKPFTLYVTEKNGVAKGVITQLLGPWKRPVTYLSKKLDLVARGWPTCLRTIAAAAALTSEADKLTFGQDLTLITPHAIEPLLNSSPSKWLSNARLLQYQGLLLEQPRIKFATTTGLNPPTLLPESDEQMPIHDCLETLANSRGGRPDLTDQALPHAEITFYTDGYSFVRDGVRYAGAAMVNQDQQVEWEQGLPQGTSAQRAELIALTKALKLGKGKRINIFTDSRYAFATAHVHGEIYQNRGLLTSKGKEIKNKTEILTLLQAIWLPQEVVIIHCHGHQKGSSPEVIENNAADQAARQATQKSVGKQMVLLPTPVLPEKPKYTDKKITEMNRRCWTRKRHGWWMTKAGKTVLPATVADTLL
ncbi:uncharacterized protein LOC110347586 [Heterocephalus glaber]|uniref:Uncharacterized protein LOC110347586 n=1 Tax=Heterocephalus glaber TaxID=10181 RepID=A0AAX6SK59_HETGA|nr:uncharacterized protein LOC110347586 [Heterocephalus glaber]